MMATGGVLAIGTGLVVAMGVILLASAFMWAWDRLRDWALHCRSCGGSGEHPPPQGIEGLTITCCHCSGTGQEP